MTSEAIKKLLIVIVICFTFCFSGCSKGILAEPDPKAQLTKRVNNYWKYKIAKDFEKCYQLEVPEMREKLKLVDYLKSFGGAFVYLEASVDRVEINQDSAKAHINVRYIWTMAVNPEEGFAGKLEENWRFVEGSWYHQKKHYKKSKDLKQKGTKNNKSS